MQLSPEHRLATGEVIKLEPRVPLVLTRELSPVELHTSTTQEHALGRLEHRGQDTWVWVHPVEEGRPPFEVNKDGSIVSIGRDFFREDPLLTSRGVISREHFSLSVHGETLIVEDCGSRNGTWVKRA